MKTSARTDVVVRTDEGSRRRTWRSLGSSGFSEDDELDGATPSPGSAGHGTPALAALLDGNDDALRLPLSISSGGTKVERRGRARGMAAENKRVEELGRAGALW